MPDPKEAERANNIFLCQMLTENTHFHKSKYVEKHILQILISSTNIMIL